MKGMGIGEWRPSWGWSQGPPGDKVLLNLALGSVPLFLSRARQTVDTPKQNQVFLTLCYQPTHTAMLTTKLSLMKHLIYSSRIEKRFPDMGCNHCPQSTNPGPTHKDVSVAYSTKKKKFLE